MNTTAVQHNPTSILARMEDELTSAGRLATQQWADIQRQAQQVSLGDTSRIVLTGCGDSYYAGLAMRYLLEEAADVPVVALPAMETSALPQQLTDNALMIGVSVSGKVGRTIEAVRHHASNGGRTVGVSAYADSDLALSADHTIATGLRGTPGPVPGTVNYLGSLLALTAVGNRLMEERSGTPIVSAAEIDKALAEVESISQDRDGLAGRLSDEISEPFFSVGSGPDFGSANFGVAKFLEAAATVGVAQDLEEWAHEQFFATRPGRIVVVHATRPEVAGRASSVAEMVQRVGGRYALITSLNIAAPDSIATWHIPELGVHTAPLVAWMPMAVTALTFARKHSRWPFGLDREERMETVDSSIYVTNPKRN